MIIKSILLHNFRQYKNTCKIEFSTDKEKNVTVILGDNTSGKTTIIQAFNWCLYGKCKYNLKDIINVEILNDLSFGQTDETTVEIELIHQNRLYVINRKQKVSISNYDNSVKFEEPTLKVEYKEDNGEMQEVSLFESQNTINKILPEGLSDYFFFDGEHISEINNKKDVVSAIRGLMGIDVISEGVKHLNPNSSLSVISKLNKELDVGQDAKNKLLKEQIIEEKQELEDIDKKIDESKDEIEYLTNRKNKLEQIIRENQKTKEKQIEKDRTERNLMRLETNIISFEKRLVKDFSRDAYKFFALPLYKKAIKILENTKMDGEGIPKMHQEAIEYILNRGKCICGCDLTKNQGAVEAINYEKSLLPPGNIGTEVRNYKKLCIQNQHDTEDFYETIRDDFKEIRTTANQISDEKQHFDDLSNELKGNEDVGQYEIDNSKNEALLESAQKTLYTRIQRKGNLENSIDSKEKEVNRLAATNQKNIKLQKNINYAIALYNWFNKAYETKEKEVKHDLYESINKYFSETYHGDRIVEIDDNYHIKLKTKVANGIFVTDTSPGLDTVKNFAFITGLVDIAKRKANDKMEEYENVEPYPIVMDAPFSNADEKHIENISRILPEVAEQVIMVIMRKDWEYAKNTILDKTEVVYEISKHGETYSDIRRIK